MSSKKAVVGLFGLYCCWIAALGLLMAALISNRHSRKNFLVSAEYTCKPKPSLQDVGETIVFPFKEDLGKPVFYISPTEYGNFQLFDTKAVREVGSVVVEVDGSLIVETPTLRVGVKKMQLTLREPLE